MDLNSITDARTYYSSFKGIFLKEGQSESQAKQNAKRKTAERFPIDLSTLESSRDIDLRESAPIPRGQPAGTRMAAEYFSVMRDLNLSDGYSEAVASTLAYSKTRDIFREATPSRGELLKEGEMPKDKAPEELCYEFKKKDGTVWPPMQFENQAAAEAWGKVNVLGYASVRQVDAPDFIKPATKQPTAMESAAFTGDQLQKELREVFLDLGLSEKAATAAAKGR